MAHVARAEVKWLRAIVADLRSGRLTYPSEEEIRRISSSMGGPSPKAVARIAKEMRKRRPAKRVKPGRRRR